MMGLRNELKFYITPFHHALLLSRLSAVLSPDPYMKERECYTVRSLYFDDPEEKSYFDKINGVENRTKYRLRFYNEDTSFLRLEKKEKLGKLSRKTLFSLTFKEGEDLMAGKNLDWKREDLLGELNGKIHFEKFRPTLLVDYERRAFCYPAGDVRITLDSRLKGAVFRGDLLSPAALLSVPTMTDHILEVKFTSFLPPFIKELLSDVPKVSSAISKFCLTREFLF